MKNKIIVGSVAVVVLTLSIFVHMYESKKDDKKLLVFDDGEYADISLSQIESGMFDRPREANYEIIEDSTKDMDTKISKLWFELKQSGKGMEELSEALVESLEMGIIPQVVGASPLLYVSENEVGFIRSVILFENNYAEYISIVGPKELGDMRVRSFFVRGTEVLDMGYIPFIQETYGRNSQFVTLTGYALGSRDLVMVNVDPYSMEVYDLDFASAYGVEGESRGGYIVIENSDESLFIYDDFISEGEVSGDLLLIVPIDEETSKEYRLNISRTMVVLEER